MALTGCGAPGRAPPELHGLANPLPDALVPLGDGRWVAAVGTPTGVALVFVSSQSDPALAASAAAFAGANSLHLLSYGGATGEEWNTFAYGTAAEGVARIVLDSHRGRGGRAVAGAWVIALRERDLAPDALSWRFVGADGATMVAGGGLLDGAP